MAEKEYIERDKAITFMEETRDGLRGTPPFVELLNQCIDALRRIPSADEAEVLACAEANLKYANDSLEILRQIHEKVSAPAADVVEVVRCKDCKWWVGNKSIADSQKGHCFEHGMRTNGYAFCSCGERKEQK